MRYTLAVARMTTTATTEGDTSMSFESMLLVAINSRNGNELERLLSWNDRNGIYSYEDNVREFGEMSREEWIDALIDSASIHICGGLREYLVRDDSGRGYAATFNYSDFAKEEREHKEDEEDEYCETFGEWLVSCDIGDEYKNTDEMHTVIRTK